jgi:hypothetical protein
MAKLVLVSAPKKLVLVSARKSRGAGFWDKDDYDVRLGDKSGPVVGRIMLHPQAPEATAVVLDDNGAGATALGL